MKRQRGRNRGGNSGGGGGGKPQHNVNRAFESNGPDNVKIRGNAQHVFEKYQQLARDATSAGDRVLGENYLQHAEHYFRVIRAVQPNKPASEIMGRDSFASGYDIDFEDESGAQALDEAPAEGDQAQPQGEGSDGANGEQRDRQDREWQGRRDERPRDDRNYNQDRYRDERPRDDRPRDAQQQPREDRFRDGPREGNRRDRYGRDRDRDRGYDRDRNRDPMAVVEPESTPLTAPSAVPAAEADEGPRLRSQDGSVSAAPAFLQARPAAPEPAAEEPERKPRRRRAPRSFEGGEGEAPAPTETEEA